MNFLMAVLASGLFLTSSAADIIKGGFGAAKGEDAAQKTERKSDTKPKQRTYPFHGTLDSVDAKQKTLTLRGKKKNRIIIYTSDTRIFKSGASAKISDGTPGERVTGSVRKNAEGKEEAITIRFGTKESIR